MSEDIFNLYRPTTFKAVSGQDKACKVLQTHLKNDTLPHALLFTGGSGCGKTTLARITKDKLGCTDRDFVEINAAESRGIDMVRDIKKTIHMLPLGGKDSCRVYLIDECHKMTSDAQSSLLKILEEPPRHVYFMLATTDPVKMHKTIRTRCTEIRCEEISHKAMEDVVNRVLDKEDSSISDDVKQKLIRVADGSARKALVILKSVMTTDDEAEQIQIIEKSDYEVAAVKIVQRLIDMKTTWVEIATILAGVDEEPESIRRMILGYCQKCMGPKASPFLLSRCYLIISAFSENYFDTGKAGLYADCYKLIMTNNKKR